jgi:nucleoside-diphosphate-sugar epimerase
MAGIVNLNKIGTVTKNGDSFAVKAEERYSLKELAGIFEKTTDKKLNIKWGGSPNKQKEVMIPWNIANVVPGWKPLISVFDGIKEYKS